MLHDYTTLQASPACHREQRRGAVRVMVHGSGGPIMNTGGGGGADLGSAWVLLYQNLRTEADRPEPCQPSCNGL